jgi:hypothetical protein
MRCRHRKGSETPRAGRPANWRLPLEIPDRFAIFGTDLWLLNHWTDEGLGCELIELIRENGGHDTKWVERCSKKQ